MEEKSVFQTLNAINVNAHTEQKNGLTYLSWAWAWSEVKKVYPEATYEIVKQKGGKPYVHDDSTGYMVYTRVTIGDITHEMWLPVMDSANNAMKSRPYKYSVKNPNFKYAKKGVDGVYRDRYGYEQQPFIEKTVAAATMFDINKAIMRCLTKNLAMFGLGLYIYAGEDLPTECCEMQAEEVPKETTMPKPKEAPKAKPNLADMVHMCADCGKEIKVKDIEAHVNKCLSRWGAVVCGECAKKRLAEADKEAEELAQDLKHIEELKRAKVTA